MSSINSTFETAEQKDAILYPYILAITFSQLTISSVGLLLNGSLIYVVVKNKCLQNSTGLFLSICSFCDGMVELSIMPTTVLVLTRKRIPLLTCAYFTVHSTGSNSNSYFNLFFLSCDRLFAVAFPFRYKMRLKRLGTRKYVAILNCISLVYILCNSSFFAVPNAIAHPEILTYCEPGDIYQGGAVFLAYHTMMVVTLSAVFNYIVMYIILKRLKRQDDANQRETTRQIFKSLAVIMCVIFFSYPLYGYSKANLLTMFPSPIWKYFITRNQMVPIAQAMNAPVLFICSSQYREVFKKEFKLIRYLFSKYSSTSSTPTIQFPPTTIAFPGPPPPPIKQEE